MWVETRGPIVEKIGTGGPSGRLVGPGFVGHGSRRRGWTDTGGKSHSWTGRYESPVTIGTERP